jgi:hypothetical protein
MNEEARLLMLIWESISDFISTGDKQEAADAIVGSFVEGGHDLDLLFDADGECPFIDRALSAAQIEDEDEPYGEDEF